MALQSFTDPNSDAARQHLLDSRCIRKHPKRHRTLKRQKALANAKRRRVQHQENVLRKERSVFLARARAYWAGEADGHP